jgi:asparagine synthase (glutamine-hydrolysing)
VRGGLIVCGIAGYVGPTVTGVLSRMLLTLRHRGPDDTGMHEEPSVGIGMTRLAIIDLAGGRQPMTNEDASLWIVFNGEIYNHKKLRQRLEARGHRFRTRSDTEAILHLYEESGERCLDDLSGMFAFAIWDARRATLFLARDRLGKKPLYYWHRAGVFLFASEIKALLCHPAVSRDVDLDALHHYLAFGYTPGERSIFAEIAKLPPAHTATLHQGNLSLRRYWRLPAGQEAQPRSRQETAARVRRILCEAVADRLESDVPLGVFLSGGIDSSAVVACMREATSQRIATFSIGFGASAPSFDELPYACLVARRFGTEHTEEILEPKVADLLPTLVDHFDEPFADSSAIPTFVVAQATARHVKVALSGIGGDETFGGYPRYLGVRFSELYGRVPRPLRAIAGRALLRTVADTDNSRNWADWIRRFVAGADRPLPDRYIGWTRFFDDEELSRLATPALQAAWGAGLDSPQRAAFADRCPGDSVEGAIRIDLQTYLPEDLLVMADRMSMAHSLELRAPFCDHRLIEESLRVPSRTKIPGTRLKGLLKTAFADVLPAEVLSHRKQGFMIPLGRWLRTELRDLMEDLLSPARLRSRGLFVPDAVQILKREHLEGTRSHSDRLWTLMMAELWMRRYLDQSGLWSLRHG